MNSAPSADATFAWDQYWHDGRLASCGGEGGVNYQPAITEGWQRFFADLADGAHVLDICTGNGAVARLAAQAAHQRNLTVTIEAVDSATLNPAAPGPGTGMIHFLPRTPAESLPFADATFDVVVGQYAIEYTDVPRTLAELRRTSRPAARVRFVTHAANSVVVQGAKQQLADAERLTDTGIFEAAEGLVHACAAEPGAVAVEVARARFVDALRALQDARTRALDVHMYQNVGNVLVDAIQQQARVGTRPVLDKVLETATAVRAHRARLSAMCRSALDAPGADALIDSAQRLWDRPFTREPLTRSDGVLFGWIIASSDSATAD